MEKVQKGGILKSIGHFYKLLMNKITGMFEFEEAEVNFKREGKRIRYTYKKAVHKHVA